MKRYEAHRGDWDQPEFEEEPEGRWVEYSVAKQLQKENEQLKESVEFLQSTIKMLQKDLRNPKKF